MMCFVKVYIKVIQKLKAFCNGACFSVRENGDSLELDKPGNLVFYEILKEMEIKSATNENRKTPCLHKLGR